MTRLRILAAGGLLAAVVGCSGGAKFAPVSGVVTLNGKPYPKAVVSFQPIGTPENPDPRPGVECVHGRERPVRPEVRQHHRRGGGR